MLQFNALAAGSFRLTGGGKPILVFPPNGIKAATEDAIVIISTPEELSTKGVVSWPGEYNASGVSMRGVGHEEGRQTSFVLECDGVRVGILSSPLRDWTDRQIETVPDIDVLAIPADDAKLVQKLVDEFDPRVILLLPGKDLAGVEKTLGSKERLAEYKLKGSLPSEGREVFVLVP